MLIEVTNLNNLKTDRMIKIHCDECKNELSEDSLITISGGKNELSFNNNMESNSRNLTNKVKIYHLNNHRPLHFCSKKCCVNFFFYE